MLLKEYLFCHTPVTLPIFFFFFWKKKREKANALDFQKRTFCQVWKKNMAKEHIIFGKIARGKTDHHLSLTEAK